MNSKSVLKIFFIFIFFLSTFNIVYSLDQIYLEKNGFCVNYEINFKIYNKTEYEKYKEDDDYSFQNLSEFNYEIREGPFDTSKLLVEGKTNKTGEFKYTFNNSSIPYYIKIEKKDSGFEKYEDTLTFQKCAGFSLYNKTFLEDGYFVELIESYTNFQNNPIILNRDKIYNETNIEIVNITKKQFFKCKEIKVGFLKLESYKNYKILFNDSGKLKNVEYTLENYSSKDYLVFSFENEGIYFIKGNKVIVENNSKNNVTQSENIDVNNEIEKDLINSSINNKNETSSENISNKIVEKNENELSKNNDSVTNVNSNKKDLSDPLRKTKKNNLNNILKILFFGVMLFIIIWFVIAYKKKKNKKVIPTPVVNSDDLEYKKVKKFVQKYKETYTKDQIFRALKKANISYDLIRRVFNEEF